MTYTGKHFLIIHKNLHILGIVNGKSVHIHVDTKTGRVHYYGEEEISIKYIDEEHY